MTDPQEAGKYLIKNDGPVGVQTVGDDNTITIILPHASEPPEDAPPIWNVPYARNLHFTGRDAFLRSLRRVLVPGDKKTAFTQAISGLPGIGKTQVAVEYAHRYAHCYEAVLWVQADSPEVLTAAWLRLATDVLGLPEQQEAEQQLEQVKRWLQTHRGWLLILDNVEEPHHVLSAFLPSKHQGNVLITTRMSDAGPLARCEKLPLLLEDEGVLLLLRRAGCIKPQASVKKATDNDVLLAKALCKLMNMLPLALDQAGAYIAENGCSLQRYIDLYQQSRPQLLDRRTASDHPDSVLTTFWLSWEQIQKQNTLAGKALEFCAFLAPDQIPEPLVQAGITDAEAESPSEALELDEALGLLHRYSLVERTEQTLSLHRLVQEVTQAVLSEEERHQWMEQAVLVVNAVFPSGEHGTWPLCAFLLPHALQCTQWIEVLGWKELEGRELLNNTGGYLYERAQYEEAEPLLQRALTITEQQLGALHPDTATCLNNLAELYRAQGRYGEAEPPAQRALTIHEEQLGDQHPDTATCLNNLALLYEAQGRYGEAEPLAQRALKIYEEQLGALHPDTAASLNNLAALYERQGRYDEAEPLLQRALTSTEQQLGDQHPKTATCLNNLAALYERQGRYDEAEPLFQRALTIREEQLGADHPATATSLDNLAALYERQGRYDEAEPLYKRALTITEQQLGTLHPQTAASLNNLAGLYVSQGRYDEAEPLAQRALTIHEEQLGDQHPDTATSLNNLAELYRAQGRYDEAEPLYKRALTIHEEQLDALHPDTAASLNNLALLYDSQGRYEEAEPLYKRALTIYEEQLGDQHPSTATSLNNLAALYEDQGRYEEAELLYERAVGICMASLGMEHPHTQQTMMNHLTLLADLHTGGDLEALLQLLTQKEQNDDTNRGTV